MSSDFMSIFFMHHILLPPLEVGKLEARLRSIFPQPPEGDFHFKILENSADLRLDKTL